jgi:hypothetical protein
MFISNMDHSDIIIAELYHDRESTLKSKLAKFEANAFINTTSLLVYKLFGNNSISSAWSSKPQSRPPSKSSFLRNKTNATNMVCHLILTLHPLVSIVLHLMTSILTRATMLNLVFYLKLSINNNINI